MRPLTLSSTADESGTPALRPLNLSQDPAPVAAAPAPAETSPMAALKRGVTASLNPFGADEKDFQAPRTGVETALEVGANVATDIITTIGVSAGAGALVGSVVPGAGTAAGTVAGLGLGIYRALGYEDLQSRAKGEEFNYGRAALNVAAEINPLLKFGGRAVKFGTQGALQALQALAYGGSGTEAVISGVVGGGLGAVGHRGKSAAKPKPAQTAGVATMLADDTMSPESLQRLVNTLDENDNSAQLARRAYDKMAASKNTEDQLSKLFVASDLFDNVADETKLADIARTLPENMLPVGPEQMKAARRIAKTQLKAAGLAADPVQLARLTPAIAKQQALEDHTAGFARWIVKQPGAKITPELFAEAKDKLAKGAVSQSQAFEMYRTQHYLKEAATEHAAAMAKEGTGLRDPLGLNVFRFFSDLKFASRAMDRVTGLNLEGMTDAVSYKKNIHGTFMFEITSRTNKLLKQAKKAGLDRREITKLLEAGADKKTEGAAGEVLQGFRTVFDDILEYGNKNGLKMDRVENYVTRLSLDPAEMITSLRRRALQYRNGKDLIRPEALADTELHAVLEHVTGVTITGDGNDAARMIRVALNKLNDISASKTKDGFEAVGTFQRKGDIPDFARELDIGRILVRYANNTSKTIHMDPILRQLQMQVPVLDALGFDKSVAYLDKYIKGMSGQPSEFVGWMNASQIRWKTGLDRVVDLHGLTGFQAKGAEVAKSMPDFLSWSLSLIYPNYLGLSTKAVLRNYTQPFMMTAPELQGKYGYKVVTGAIMDTLADKRAGVDWEATLTKLGYVPGQHIGEGMNEAASALRSTVVGPVIAGIDKINEKLMMSLYSKSDVVNRYITAKTAKRLTKDILAGIGGAQGPDQQAAMKFVANLSPGVKASIYKLGKENRMDQVEDLLARYLISKTQFNYGPQAASEYVRVMGRLFGMFTKWPAMVTGDIHELAVTGRYRTMAERYLLPWAALGGVQLWLSDTKESPRKRALLGKSLLDISPVSAIGGIATPPVIDILGGIGGSFMDAAALDFEKAGKGMMKTLTPVIPLVHGVNRGAQEAWQILNNKKAPWRDQG